MYGWKLAVTELNETGLRNVSLANEGKATTNQAVIVILFFPISTMTAVIGHDQSYQYVVDFA